MVDSSTSAFVPWLGVPAQHLLPMGVLLAYFATIAVLFRFVFLAAAGRKPEKVGRVAANGRDTGRWAQGFLAVARAALAHTWYHMLSYMAWSYQEFYAFEGASSVDLPPLLAFSTWLDKTSLFTQAWDIVLRPGIATWISEHITNYTITFWVLFVWVYIQPETGVVGWKTLRWGKKEGAAFVLLGQLVAISVAAALFFSGCAARGLGASKRGELRVPLGVWAPLLLSASLSALVPMTVDQPTFLPNLLLFHVLLFIPFLPLQGRPSLSLSIQTTFLLLLAPTIPALAHWPPDPLSVADTFWSGNHALRSIGSDAIWSCGGLTAWSVWQKKGWTSLAVGIVVFWLSGSALGFGLDI